ncbi:LOW QUALITY PROTEIN: unconventional myosin-X-like, partial [Pollicipes pollicipes]|uniref:LOW QUALITY PROTEIN: unconventional myosin-X-like n=1 Tax=Pollicipes pollicipes TaxID=41117 RepID=UPI0018849B26
CTNPGKDSGAFLGVLDIFGFENFGKNSFEQLCINYTNEKLHTFFNHYVFALEQEAYRQEEIKFSHIKFSDNSECLELIEKPPRCILKLLSEECRMPKGSDETYLSKLHQEFEVHPYYIKARGTGENWESEFGVCHYAGRVTYNITGFVDKNRDSQQDLFFDFMSRSKNKFVEELAQFQDLLSCMSRTGTMSSTVSRGTSKGKPTVSDAFRQQLQALVDLLPSSNPWYVRCIKPNGKKQSHCYDDPLVLDQLKYLGMLDIIKIRKQGFPIHLPLLEFCQRYQCLTGRRWKQQTAAEGCSSTALPEREWQMGKTKMFLRHCVHEPLEDKRTALVHRSAVCAQKIYRGYVRRKAYREKLEAVRCLQRHYRAKRQRLLFLRQRRAVVVLQSHLRGMFAREVAAALREMRAIEEERQRREKLEEEKRKEEERRLEMEEEARKRLEDEEKPPPPEAQQNGKLIQEEIDEMTEIADHLNMKLSAAEAQPGRAKSSVSVDLDNLFSFLSDMNSGQSSVVNEIRENLEELEQTVLVEMDELSDRRAAEPRRSAASTPTLPHPSLLPDDASEPPRIPKEPIYESILVNNKKAPSDPEPAPPAIPSVPPPGPPPGLPAHAGLEKVQRAARHRLRSGSPGGRARIASQAQSPSRSRNGSRNGSRRASISQEEDEREQRRRQRVERKLQELQELERLDDAKPEQEEHHDMIEFAERYFNMHERVPEGAIISTLSRRSRAGGSVDYLPKYEMITYTKAPHIPTSHVHMYDPDDVDIACAIFKDLQQYLKGDMKPETEIKTIQTIVQHGIEREELRNEIYVQCIRQITNNPIQESLDRVWLLLSLCVVSFPPGKILFKYFVCFLRKSQYSSDSRALQYVQWCLENCKHTHVTCRKNPPSTVEVTAMKRLGTIVCRFFFLDGMTKAVDVHPMDTAADAMTKIADRIGLWNLDGWAVFQATAEGEHHVKSHEYLYDVISSWEIEKQQRTRAESPASSPMLRRQSAVGVGAGENRFLFKKRLFKSTREIPNDPVEVHMLYSQAVYSVVQSDSLPVSEKVALQLAGLQAQVLLGDPKDKYDHYSDVATFLSQRVASTKRRPDWVPIIAHAHHQYGSGKSELVAKIWYLSCVMQYPVWGTTQFPVKYKGYWPYGNNLNMGINCEGILLIRPDDKYVIVEFPYGDVESILLDPSDDFITVNLHRNHDAQRVFVFEARWKDEMGALIASYSPEHATWIREVDNISRRIQHITNDDRIRLHYNVVQCRRNLVDADMMRKPVDLATSNFFKNTLRRFNKAKLEKLRQTAPSGGSGDGTDAYKGFDRVFWGFSRQPISQGLSRIAEPEVEETAVQIFQAVLMFSGLVHSDQLSDNSSDENNVRLVQGIVDRAMKNETLLNELALQLIKQTTDHPDPNSRVNRRHWSLMALLCSTVVPSNLATKKYLAAHLTKCASDYVTEEGKYARFAEKCLYKTVNSRRRQWAPSRQEVLCTVNCRPIHARFHFMDGQFHSVEFEAAATAGEVLQLVKEKIGLKADSKGYAIYEVLGQSERNLLPDETLADVMSKWERYQTATAGTDKARKQHIFLFKKHLLCDETLDLDDRVEKELLYHQMLHNVRNDKFPLTTMEAVMLTALRAQIELGDYNLAAIDYQQVMAYTLPPRVASVASVHTVTVHHQSLEGMSSDQAKQAFLNLIQSWPFYRASIFEVVQSFTSNWPKMLWLAVDEHGVHLLDFRSRNVLCTYEYDYIVNYSPAINSLMIITGSTRKQSKIILNTGQAFMIANLVKDYTQLIKERLQPECREQASLRAGAGAAARPMSILQRPAPPVGDGALR